ncbi:MAG: hypothetical protein KC777_13025 [Cyanobacteria bacterium HKST-UBA02]|nr:hypothetical protein [Cyanobacteria bacterium HKST-UBA02]
MDSHLFERHDNRSSDSQLNLLSLFSSPAVVSELRPDAGRTQDFLEIFGHSVNGFKQPLSDRNDGACQRLWKGIKSTLGAGDTAEDLIAAKVKKQLSPSELEQYQNEERTRPGELSIERTALAKFSPMHLEVEKRVKQIEAVIDHDVRSKFSKHDRGRLDDSLRTYERDIYKHLTRERISIFDRQPEPPANVQDYYTRIQEATEKFLREPRE